jgi:hypothetical protein
VGDQIREGEISERYQQIGHTTAREIGASLPRTAHHVGLASSLVSDPNPAPTGPVDDAVDPAVYRRRRLAVGASAAAVVLLVVGLVVVVGSSGDGPDAIGAVATTTTTTTVPPTTTTTTVPPTTTTTSTTTTSTTTTTTTTTTVPVPTTILENGVPIWEPYEILPPLDGIAALTGLPADASITSRPIVAVKVDNFSRARPQWNLDQADTIIEENVEGVTRFIGMFHTNLPDRAGPVRSARTGDLDLFAAMNRPVLAWSGGNRGVTNWIESAARSNLLVNFTAQRSPCYQRSSSRRTPHNLLLDPTCATNTALAGDVPPGPARPLYWVDPAWEPAPEAGGSPDETFRVEMDGVTVDWTWDAASGSYLRSQNGNPHVAISGNRIAVQNVVELFTDHPPSPVDARSPNPVTVGFGRAVIHRAGQRIEAVWGRATPYEAFGFSDAATRTPIRLAGGKTFIELARA